MDPPPIVEDQQDVSDLDFMWDSDQDYDKCVDNHDGSDLCPRSDGVLPEDPVTTEDVKIEDSQLCGSDNLTPGEINRLRPKIRKFRHLSITKGDSLPPATSGVVCDIVVGGARPVTPTCRKLVDFIKGLLSAKMISYSRSPWASPIVVIIKKNGVNVRLGIDHLLFNCLTQLTVYPMTLINDLLDYLESTFWYCLLDMASGFWVAKMLNYVRLISAFVTPIALFE
ncbi:reverse transcriptase [Phytophthora megakarya]|uniref:Reverse transcriptase n=1 Tax=Phytophthora megakarya TaxID=4795 RepID=A0A225W4Z2_9STRA|nr:reverse transcriptase [Phytophthora megakarya]